MDNDNVLPLKVGQLPKTCYVDWQEFANDLAKVLSLPQDNKEIIQGAKGDKGDKGARGSTGPIGPPGQNTTIQNTTHSIPEGVIYVEIPVFVGWEAANYKITNTGKIAPVSGGIEFVPASGYIGVGTIVLVDASPSPTNLRVYFTFSPGITETPDDQFVLQVTKLS